MKQKIQRIGDLSEAEEQLVFFYRMQSPRVQEILINITRYETDLEDVEPTVEAVIL